MAGVKLGEFGGQLDQPIPSEATQHGTSQEVLWKVSCVERVETISQESTPKRVEAPSQRKLR
jgi:hypothetical protein